MTGTLTEFLLARLLEQQRHAEALAVTMESGSFTAPAALVNLGALVNPARVLADVEAKRAVVYGYLAAVDAPADHTNPTIFAMSQAACVARMRALENAMSLLARPFSTHPDFDPAWLDDLVEANYEKPGWLT